MFKVGSVTDFDASGYVVGPHLSYTLTGLETAAINGTLVAGATYLISDFGLLAIAGTTTDYKIINSLFGGETKRWFRPQSETGTLPPITCLASPTTQGATTSRSVGSSSRPEKHPRMGYISSGTGVGLIGGHYWTNGQFYSDLGFIVTYRFACSDGLPVLEARGFVGIGTNLNSATNVEPSTLTNCIGIAQLSTSNYAHLVYGGSSAQTPIDLGYTYPISAAYDLYELIIARPPGTGNTHTVILRRYNGSTLGPLYRYTTTLGTSSTVVPASGSLLAPRAWRTNNTSSSYQVGIDVQSLTIFTWN